MTNGSCLHVCTLFERMQQEWFDWCVQDEAFILVQAAPKRVVPTTNRVQTLLQSFWLFFLAAPLLILFLSFASGLAGQKPNLHGPKRHVVAGNYSLVDELLVAVAAASL